MSGPDSVLECSFFIPIRRDGILSDGEFHSPELWGLFQGELFVRFGGWTKAPGLFQGVYRDPNTGDEVPDESFKYIVAVEESSLGELRTLLSGACVLFQQKCVYLSVAGEVEFIGGPGP